MRHIRGCLATVVIALSSLPSCDGKKCASNAECEQDQICVKDQCVTAVGGAGGTATNDQACLSCNSKGFKCGDMGECTEPKDMDCFVGTVLFCDCLPEECEYGTFFEYISCASLGPKRARLLCYKSFFGDCDEAATVCVP